MKTKRSLSLGASLCAAALIAAGCGGDDKSAPTTPGSNGDSGKSLTIGVKFDQPGLAQREPDGSMEGFDVDVAEYIAEKLGVSEGNITWKEAVSAQRENLIENGEVDFIVATYSITDKRKEKVSFAGPYFVAGQSLLVSASNSDITGPESLNDGKKLCSVTGSTSAQKVKDKFAADVQLQEFDTYTACVDALRNGVIDAVTTDDIILAGFAAQSPGDFKVVGKPFSTENYGVGLKKDDKATRDKINDAIESMVSDGSWEKAFTENLGDAGYPLPAKPTVERY